MNNISFVFSAALLAILTTVLPGNKIQPGPQQPKPVAGASPDCSKAKGIAKVIVTAAIERYVNDLDPETAKQVMSKYTAELAGTYIAFAGSGTMSQSNDYVRIDGPGIRIEYSCQPSRDFPGTTHPLSVWRDHTSDYGGN